MSISMVILIQNSEAVIKEGLLLRLRIAKGETSGGPLLLLGNKDEITLKET